MSPSGKRIVVKIAGVRVADTMRAIALKEASYPLVQYIPRADADMTLLTPTARATHCPYKGDASYFSLAADGATADNAVWSYETPFPAMQQIAGYLAFYPNKVDRIEEF